jgi:hypothetical protein
MKRLLAALCLVTCLSSCGPATPTSSAPPSPPSIPATSLVQNGDFSQGIARWDGDARLAAAPGPGITVRLNLAAWTRVYQTFRSAAGTQFAVRVNYKLTPGMYTSDDPANFDPSWGILTTYFYIPVAVSRRPENLPPISGSFYGFARDFLRTEIDLYVKPSDKTGTDDKD